VKALLAGGRRRPARGVRRKSNELRTATAVFDVVVVVVVVAVLVKSARRGRRPVEQRPQQRRLASAHETVGRRLERLRKRPLRTRRRGSRR